MLIALTIFGIAWLVVGVYSVIFYIFDYVIREIREEKGKFEVDMILVMLMALLVPPLYWFLRALFKHPL